MAKPLPPEYMKMREIAAELRISIDTLRRYFADGKLADIEWVDFLGNGKFCATRESFEAFKADRLAKAKKVFSQSL